MQLSRRLFIGRMAAVAPALAIAPLTASATIADTDAEDPRILAIGAEVEPKLRALNAARAAKQAAREVAERLCPPIPDELIVRDREWYLFAGCRDREVDVEGNEVWPAAETSPDGRPVQRLPRQIIEAEFLRQSVENGNTFAPRRGGTRFAKRVWRLIEVGERYEAAREAAIETSGLRPAMEALHWAADDIRQLASRSSDLEPATFAGVAVFARVMLACDEAGADAMHNARFLLAPRMATAIDKLAA